MQVSALTPYSRRTASRPAIYSPLADARAARSKLRNEAKKIQKQRRQQQQAVAAAADLIPVIYEASDVVTLETVLAEAKKWAGLVPALDEEIFVGEERLRQLRIETQTARKTATFEVQSCSCSCSPTFYLACSHDCLLQAHLEHYESVQVELAHRGTGHNNAVLHEEMTAALNEKERPPDGLECPITNELMLDPVICADGHSYERAGIAEWLQDHDTSPSADAVLEHKHLIPNHALRKVIAARAARSNLCA